MQEITALYADTVTGFSSRAPGIVRVQLGRTQLNGEDPQVLLDLIMPRDAARSLANGLVRVVEDLTERSREDGEQSDEEVRGRAAVQAVSAASLFALQRLLHMVAADPAFATRLDDFERQVLHNTRNMVTEGISIDHEADAMSAALDVLKSLFEMARADRGDEDGKDAASD